MKRISRKRYGIAGWTAVALWVAIATGLASDEGRAGLDWWSLRPLARPRVPSTTSDPDDRGAFKLNPIDSFVLERLEAADLHPAPPADRLTLIRRVTLDLTGLPPTPQEIDAFLHDDAEDAYERLVDRLLASPHYGERWARHWLDVARFSESQGFERDIIREHSWRYRDYVIQSLNSDLPYDVFVREQIAGDVAEPVTTEGIVATGFLVAGAYDEAGNGSKSELLRARIREEELEDIIGTMSQAFLGLTVHCARCHDHKFDPIPQRDYYRIKAVFAGVRHGNRPALGPAAQERRKQEWEQLAQSIGLVEVELGDLERPVRAKLAGSPGGSGPAAAAPRPLARWSFESGPEDDVGSLHGTLRGGAVVRSGKLLLHGPGAFVETVPLQADLKAKTLEVWARLNNVDQRAGGLIAVQTIGGAVFDAIVYGEREAKKWIAGSDGFQRTRDLAASPESTAPGQLIHIAITYNDANQIQIYRDGQAYGEAYVPAGPNGTLRTFSSGKSQVLFGLRHSGAGNGYFTGELEEARLYDRALTSGEVESLFRAGVPAFSEAQVVAALSESDRARHAGLLAQRQQLRARLHAIEPAPQTYAANPRQPDNTFLLLRGDVEKKADAVSPGTLSCTPATPDIHLPPDAPESMRRRTFAEWITHPANPLTARVIANRIWHYHFGQGIVATPSDLGYNGDRPSHPELLDWLAVELIDSGWSLKHLHRLIVRSGTYRQSSAADRDAASVDAENRLLWRFPPRRLEGEAVRDAMLAASGELNRQMLGPSFRPFELKVFNSHFYHLNDPIGPQFNRRTVYRIHVNSAKEPLLDSMDCPDPSTKTPKRNVTTTPIQALALMNSSFVQRQSRQFAARLAERSGNTPEQVAMAYRLALGRQPTAAELDRALPLVRDEGLIPLCWALLNSSEFQYLR